MAKDTDNLCPVLLGGKLASPAVHPKSARCRGARCTWWDRDKKDCGVNVIREQLKKGAV